MKRRAFAVFFVFLSMFVLISVRLVSISFESKPAAFGYSSASITVDTLRGTVYDCNMIPLTNRETVLYAAAKPSEKAFASLRNAVAEDDYNYVEERMKIGKPVVVRLEKSINENDDIKLVKVPQRYDSQNIACHIIGYRNASGNGISGMEKAFDSLLSDVNSEITVRFSQNAQGGVMLGEEINVEGNILPQSGVVLTIDYNIQKIAEKALDSSGYECAAAVVIEIESGAIRACVSRPSFDPDNIAEYLKNENSPLINRALLPFSVGSVFKPIVAAAALENGISESFEYNCTGSAVYNGVTFNCHKKDGHGLIDMKSAVANSCNTYFIALALETGADNIIKIASDFGLGQKLDFSESVFSSAGNIPNISELDSDAAVANVSFGQGSLLATPVQICSSMATIARKGVYVKPYLVEGEVNSQGEFVRIKKYTEKKQIISYGSASKLCRFLECVVNEGSGVRAKSSSVSVAGKTATAQTGRMQNGEEIYNAWFSGYFPADNPQYAVTVMIENGGEGAVSCAPVFKNIAENIDKITK